VTDRHANAGTARDVRPLAIVDNHGAYVLHGADSGAGVESLILELGGVPLVPGGLGVPVAYPCELGGVAATWLSDTEPGEDWVATFQYRAPDAENFADVATFAVRTAE
jgi:hypothetical protein